MAYSTSDIRNICLVGLRYAGKTQLTEALLHAGGAIPQCGTVEQGNTVSDFRDRERQLGHSLHPSICHFDHAGIHVNLVDTPGHRDLYGRALSVLPAVETAAVVIDAQTGIEAVTRRVMAAARARRLCRMIIVNKIDVKDADLAGLVDDIRAAFGPECLPINLPGADGEAVIDCYFQPDGATTAFGDVASAHEQIVDQVVEIDEGLMELYLEQGEELGPEQLHDAFEKALREGHLVPICFVSAKTGAGITELLDVFERLMPNPLEGNPPTFLQGEGENAAEVRVTASPTDHVIAHVVSVNIDPYKGRLAVFRIHQGTLRTGMQLFVGDARKPLKVTQMLKLNGSIHVPASIGVPGDVCAIPRVEEAYYDSVLHDSHDEDHFHLKPVPLPPPMFGLAIRPNDADVQKASDALHALQTEDPSLRLDHIRALNELVLRGTGELHLKSVLEDVADRYGIRVESALPSIAYRETITARAEGHHRHKKQSGGAGQFGEVFLRVEPLPQGTGFRFESEVVGGAIPSQFIPAVEAGVRQIMESGAIAGYPMQDIGVTVYDGKHHSVDSKEVAFIQAGKKAFLDAISKAAPILMEPVVDVTIRVPAGCVGGVTGDLSTMRGIVSGTSMLPDNRMEVMGQAPLEAIQGYHSRLKSLTGGEGSFTMDLSHYARVPEQTQQELVAAFRNHTTARAG